MKNKFGAVIVLTALVGGALSAGGDKAEQNKPAMHGTFAIGLSSGQPIWIFGENDDQNKPGMHHDLTHRQLAGRAILMLDWHVEDFKKSVQKRNICLHLERLKRFQKNTPLLDIKGLMVTDANGKQISSEDYCANDCPSDVYQSLSDNDLSYLIEHQDDIKFRVFKS